MKYLKIKIITLLLSLVLTQSCGYKLGGLEVVGENSGKTTTVKIQSSKSLKQSFINSGFLINDKNFEYFIIVEGPTFSKDTVSVTSSATENEFTITGKMKISIYNKNNDAVVENKTISMSKDHNFSSSSINSSESEESIIRDDIKKYLEIQVINILRSKI